MEGEENDHFPVAQMGDEVSIELDFHELTAILRVRGSRVMVTRCSRLTSTPLRQQAASLHFLADTQINLFTVTVVE